MDFPRLFVVLVTWSRTSKDIYRRPNMVTCTCSCFQVQLLIRPNVLCMYCFFKLGRLYVLDHCVISSNYSWYFRSLPYLMLFIGVEFCWNVFPSSMYSSAMFLFLQPVVPVGLWSTPSEYPYMDNKTLTENKDK